MKNALESLKRGLDSFWWGRDLPPKYSYLAGKPSKQMTEKELDILRTLRTIVILSEYLDLDIGFGKQLTLKDLQEALKEKKDD